MSKTGSNKGIYLFWGGIALVIAIVLLIIFLPRVNSAMPYNNVHALNISIKSTDKNSHAVDFFTEAFINDANSNLTIKTNLNNLYALQKVMSNSNDFCQTALLYTSPANDFKALASQQNNEAKLLGTTLYDFQNFCTNYVTPLFDGTPFADREDAVNEMLTVYYEQYTILVQQMANFYFTTAQIMHSSAMVCMEVNQTMLDKHLELATKVHGFATSTAITTAEAADLVNQSIVLYADGYYKSFI